MPVRSQAFLSGKDGRGTGQLDLCHSAQGGELLKRPATTRMRSSFSGCDVELRAELAK